MNISDYLLEFLKQYEKVEVKGFGVFSLANSKAEIDAHEKVILPPAKRVLFTFDKEVKGLLFINYLAQKKGISLENANFELDTQVDFWLKKINAVDEFTVKYLGQFQKEKNQLVFKGSRIEKDSPDFFGLEKINYNQLPNNSKEAVSSQPSETPLTKYVFWIFLVIIPVVGLAYAGYIFKDLIIGKKEVSIKTSTHRIEEKKLPVKKDSVIIDSLHLEKNITK